MKFDFIGRRKWWYALSILIMLPGIISMAVQGFNLGIDFTGGTLLDLKFAKTSNGSGSARSTREQSI